ncbi:MAG: hypothetical protein JO267_00835 [Alphaproteobacteria bacterium]|nr:hypothetical protein [Alphaproteobacteria bacterium]
MMIFQNVYDQSVARELDPDFLPVDGRHNGRTDTREIGLFLRMFHSGLYRRASITGILSPKFNQKCRVSGRAFIEFIRQHPGYNVYFINPFPGNGYYTYNVWYHGELCHARLHTLAALLFEKAGYDTTPLFHTRDGHATLLYSSYWAGDSEFWSSYLLMITRLIEAFNSMPSNLQELYRTAPNYYDMRTGEKFDLSYLPFIFERTFSTFLHLHPHLRGLAYPFRREEVIARCYDDFEREIVGSFGDIVDEIDRRAEYTEADRKVFSSLLALRAAGTRHGWCF